MSHEINVLGYKSIKNHYIHELYICDGVYIYTHTYKTYTMCINLNKRFHKLSPTLNNEKTTLIGPIVFCSISWFLKNSFMI